MSPGLQMTRTHNEDNLDNLDRKSIPTTWATPPLKKRKFNPQPISSDLTSKKPKFPLTLSTIINLQDDSLLFSLPFEVREDIYGKVCLRDEPQQLNAHLFYNPLVHDTAGIPALLVTCRRIFDEAFPIFCNSNEWFLAVGWGLAHHWILAAAKAFPSFRSDGCFRTCTFLLRGLEVTIQGGSGTKGSRQDLTLTRIGCGTDLPEPVQQKFQLMKVKERSTMIPPRLWKGLTLVEVVELAAELYAYNNRLLGGRLEWLEDWIDNTDSVHQH